jgi:uncharacterized protein YjiS (DUF1127 family)
MFSMEKSASAHLPAARVWVQRGESVAKAVGTTARGISRWLGRGLSALERGQARRMAMRELYALDDRLLKDIGLSRDQVPATVNAMFRSEPPVDAVRPALEVGAADGVALAGADVSNAGNYKSAA